MPVDERIRGILDHTLAAFRGHLEAELRTAIEELIQTADAERQTAVQAAESAAAEAARIAEQQLGELRAAAERGKEELRTSAEKEIEEMARRISEAERDRDLSRDEAATSLRELVALRGELDAARADVETARQADERARVDLDSLYGRLPDAVRGLDEALSLRDVLANLAESAGREVDRVAMMLVKGTKVEDWRTIGFVQTARHAAWELDADELGVIRTAVRSGCRATSNGDRLTSLPAFARNDAPRDAAAWPIMVGGVPVAVLYADTHVSNVADDRRWRMTLDILTRYAGKVLELMTVHQAAGLTPSRAVASNPQATSDQSSAGSV